MKKMTTLPLKTMTNNLRAMRCVPETSSACGLDFKSLFASFSSEKEALAFLS
jgi:hypothetical protein